MKIVFLNDANEMNDTRIKTKNVPTKIFAVFHHSYDSKINFYDPKVLTKRGHPHSMS